MGQNQYKIKAKGQSKKSTLFSGLDKITGGESNEGGLPIEYLPKVVFIMVLGIFYIGNSHYSDKTTRKIDKLYQEVEDIRADYITLKSEFMYASQQSEVAKRVKNLGLKESDQPPFKIIIEEGEY